MKTVQKSSFSELVKYITNSQEKNERVGKVSVTNCHQQDAHDAALEVHAIQALNKRAETDKTYHLIVSFRAGENPPAEVLDAIESRICDGLGFGEHQRVSAVHHDTDNLHIHIAINKIHPTRLTIHTPYYDHKTLGALCEKLEAEYGLQRDNHAPSKNRSENRADDMENIAGVESLLGWIKRECLQDIKSAKNWSELHSVLSENGLEIKQQGAGLVFTDQTGITVKASSVARDLSKSKLEGRMGVFESPPTKLRIAPRHSISRKKKPVGKVGAEPPAMHLHKGRLRTLAEIQAMQIDSGKRYRDRPMPSKIDTSALYARYLKEQQNMQLLRNEAFQKHRHEKSFEIESIKRSARLKRAAIKLVGETPFVKRALYAIVNKKLREDIAAVHVKQKDIRSTHAQAYRRKSWNDWLQDQAKQGDADALAALRAREARKPLTGNTIKAGKPLSSKTVSGSKTPIGAVGKAPPAKNLRTGKLRSLADVRSLHIDSVTNDQSQTVFNKFNIPLDSVTKKGTVIYRLGQSAIRDDGDKLKLSNGATAESLAVALKLAKQRYGKRITVNGSSEFKEQVAKAAALAKIDITFDDAALEASRQKFLIQHQEKVNDGRTGTQRIEQSGEQRSRYRHGASAAGGIGGGAGSSGRVVGRVATGKRVGAIKPDIGRIGGSPPPEGKNRLRNLSQLGVVRIASGSEMLLPRDVHNVMEQQGTKPANSVRRDLSGESGRIVQRDWSLADKYIAEREEKRVRGFDIQKHARYNDRHAGVFDFAGTRQSEGQYVALLKQNDEVAVLPVDEATAARLKRLKLGDSVTVTKEGVIKKRGRSR